MKRALFVAGTGAALLAPTAVSAVNQYQSPPNHKIDSAFLIPRGKPLELQTQRLDGPDFRLSAFRGAVVFINVFATWCPPCRIEQPDLVEFAQDHRADTAVIGLNFREQDDVVRKYRDRYKIFYPIAMDRFFTHIPGLYARPEETALPATIAIKPDGTLSYAWIGNRSREFFETERRIALGLEAPPDGTKPSPEASAAAS